MPEVTVIVPALNAEATIAACLESLLGQDYPSERYRVIVVDNNSTDNTPSLVCQYPVELAFEKEVQSRGAARNRGVALADTEILAFIDSDCCAERDWLRNLVSPFAEPSVGAVGGTIDSQPAGRSLVEVFLAQIGLRSESQFLPYEPKGLPSGNVAYRRDALRKVGVFDDVMTGCEDVDLAWRVQAYGGYQGLFVPNAVVYHRHRSTLPGLYRQYRRYGRDEIVLSTLYRGQTFHRRTPAYQLQRMLKEVCALGTYCMSFVVRLFRWRRWHTDRMYLAWPVLWFVLQSGHLVGGAEGLVSTRFFRRNPDARSGTDVVREPVVAPERANGERDPHSGAER